MRGVGRVGNSRDRSRDDGVVGEKLRVSAR